MNKTTSITVLLTAWAYLATGCASDSYATQGAMQGAGSGALAGAVGAAATALIFGGDVGEAAARGAVYGGTTGAVFGGLSGADADRRQAAQEEAEYERQVQAFRREIGDDAFNGFVALTDCKHEVAMANASVAQQSSTRDYALAGLWLEVLIQADQEYPDAAGPLLDEIVERDREVRSRGDAETQLTDALSTIDEIRKEYGIPVGCG